MSGGGRGDSYINLQWLGHTFEMRVSVRFKPMPYRSPVMFRSEEERDLDSSLAR